MPRLIVKKKAEVLAEYRINRKSPVNIGSGKSNDIVISDKIVSEYHCAVTRKDDRYEVKDKNTITGTRVNDRSVTSKELQFGDVIGLGPYAVLFCDDIQRGKRKRTDERGAIEEGKSYFLLGVYGKFEGKKFQIVQGETYIGREHISPKGIENDVVLAGDMTVSKGHAKIALSSSECILTDIGSTGGVAVNGNKVGQLNDVPIAPGDEIAIGRTVFRFAEEGNDDYSTPHKHGILLLKIRQPISFLITLAVLAGSGWLGYQGVTGISTLHTKTKKADIDINRYWSPEENVVKASQAQEYDITTSPAVGDLNKDGKNDIVFLNSSGQMYVWEGKKGTQSCKSVEIFNSGKSSVVLHDMNNDGIEDIIAVSDTSMLYVIDGGTGGLIRREMLGGAVSELSPAVGDLNGDGKADVVVCSEDGRVYFIYAPGFDSMEKYTEFVEGPILATPVIVSGEGIPTKAVVCSNNSKIFLFDGKSRGKDMIDLVEKTGKAHLIAAAPAVGDLNGDGIPELVVQSNVPQYVSVIDIVRNEVKWTYFVEPIPPTGLRHTASPVVTDVNGDGLSDVVVLSANGTLYALKGETGYPTGELLWKLEIPEAKRIISSPALCDFDKDGLMDIVFGGEDGNVYVVKNLPGRKEMESMAIVRASNVPITSSVAIADVNGDGKMEIVYSNALNTVQILNTNIATFKNKIVWSGYLGNSRRSGEIENVDSSRPYIQMTALGVALLLALLIIKIMIKMKKMKKRPRMAYL